MGVGALGGAGVREKIILFQSLLGEKKTLFLPATLFALMVKFKR